MSDSQTLVDTESLPAEVLKKYRDVALPDRAVESFAGVANPFSLRTLKPGERVTDMRSATSVR